MSLRIERLAPAHQKLRHSICKGVKMSSSIQRENEMCRRLRNSMITRTRLGVSRPVAPGPPTRGLPADPVHDGIAIRMHPGVGGPVIPDGLVHDRSDAGLSDDNSSPIPTIPFWSSRLVRSWNSARRSPSRSGGRPAGEGVRPRRVLPDDDARILREVRAGSPVGHVHGRRRRLPNSPNLAPSRCICVL